MEATTVRPVAITASRRWASLGVLVVIALVSVADRQIFILLAEPVRADLGLSDVQLGMLQGLGLSAFAAVVSLPIGWAVDRRDRRWVLAVCIGVWSLAVMACAFARGFPALFAASMLVGAGEAGVIPVAYTMIPALFDGPARQLANSLYTLSGRLGAGAALALCGALILVVGVVAPDLPAPLSEMAEWRLSFIAASLLGPPMMALAFVIPRRVSVPGGVGGPEGETRRGHDAIGGSTLTEFMREHRRTYLGFYGAMAFAMFGLTALMTWLPVVAMRRFGLSPAVVGAQFGALTLGATIVAALVTSALATSSQRRSQADRPIRILVAVSSSAGIASALLPLARTDFQLLGIYAVHLTIATVGTMVYPTALQSMAPDRLRGRAVALIGTVQFATSALGPLAVGWVSGALDASGGKLLEATVYLSVPTIAASCVLFVFCLRDFAFTVAAAEACP